MQYFILGLILSVGGSLCYKAVDAAYIASTPLTVELITTVVVMIPVTILTILGMPKEHVA